MAELSEQAGDSRPGIDTRGLLELMLAGDRSAGEQLFRAHGERLRRALRPHFEAAERARLDREELVQRALAAAIGSIRRFEWRGEGAFLAWLKGIALNELRRELALRRRSSSFGGAGSAGEEAARRLERVEGREATPSRELALREEERRLEEALHTLPEEELALVTNRRILGQDYATLARDLGISEGAARMKLSRALSKVAGWLERQR